MDERHMSADAPNVRGPRDVPALRAHLLDLWRREAFAYDTADIYQDGIERPRKGGWDWDPVVLAQEDFSYFWVNEDMCDLLVAAERDFPADAILEPELVPRTQGLIVFAKP